MRYVCFLLLLTIYNAQAEEPSLMGKVSSWFGNAKTAENGKPVAPKKDDECFNVRGYQWRIVSRMAPRIYQVVTREGSAICGNAPGSTCIPIEPKYAVLITLADTFESTGVIRSNVWLDEPKGTPEMRQFSLENGFKTELRVFRESEGCAEFGRLALEKAIHQDLVERKQQEEARQKSERKIAAEQREEERKEKLQRKSPKFLAEEGETEDSDRW
jgi:hypothetical protein